MQRVFKSDLSAKGLRELNKQIRNYKNVILPTKVSEFIYELADVGIYTAKVNSGEMKPYIGFIKVIKDSKYNYKKTALVIGMNTMPNIARWYKNGTVAEAEVNSIMMAEFGSGIHADNGHWGYLKYRGTFPNQKHAFDNNGWTWVDFDDKQLHWSDGYEPTTPLYFAWLEMKMQINTIARRVFDRS